MFFSPYFVLSDLDFDKEKLEGEADGEAGGEADGVVDGVESGVTYGAASGVVDGEADGEASGRDNNREDQLLFLIINNRKTSQKISLTRVSLLLTFFYKCSTLIYFNNCFRKFSLQFNYNRVSTSYFI